MSTLPKVGPFNPGYGNKPAHFAGRKVEVNELYTYLESIVEETNEKGGLLKGAKTPFMIIGPRGVGKTALITKVYNQAETLGIDCYNLVASDFNNNFGTFVEKLTKKNASFYEKHLSEINVNLTEIINIKLKPGRGNTILEEIFEVNLKKTPMLLICDEAHEYNVEEFGDFVNLLQLLIRKSYPIAVIFAGTPQLTSVLRKINASFINRSRFIKMNRLEHEDSIEAIKVPLTKYNIEIADELLDQIANEADDYPYFLQAIGSMLWKIVYENNLSVIDQDATKNAIANSLSIREEFYAEKYSEIQNSEYYELFVKIIEFIYGKNNLVKLKELMDFLRANYSDLNFVDAKEELIGLGVIWSIKTTITPGIPSFFNYVLQEEGML